MLPSPAQTVEAFIHDFGLLMSHLKVTLLETLIGTIMGVAIGFASAVLMDRWDPAYKAMYPIIVLTQTIPAVAIAPLLVLWFGYKMMPKVIRFCVDTFSVTKKQTIVQMRVQIKEPTVSEHHPDMVAAAAPRQAAEPSPRE